MASKRLPARRAGRHGDDDERSRSNRASRLILETIRLRDADQASMEKPPDSVPAFAAPLAGWGECGRGGMAGVVATIS